MRSFNITSISILCFLTFASITGCIVTDMEGVGVPPFYVPLLTK